MFDAVLWREAVEKLLAEYADNAALCSPPKLACDAAQIALWVKELRERDLPAL